MHLCSQFKARCSGGLRVLGNIVVDSCEVVALATRATTGLSKKHFQCNYTPSALSFKKSAYAGYWSIFIKRISLMGPRTRSKSSLPTERTEHPSPTARTVARRVELVISATSP